MHFVPGLSHPPHGLLARYLPPLAEGIAAEYTRRYSQPGDLVFDPFGQSPQLALEAALIGRRVVIANFNPVARFAMRLAFDPIPETALRAALTKLGDLRKDGEHLESHLQSFYRSTCPDCGTPVSADYFEWDKERGEPIAKVFFCPTDHAMLGRPADAADVAAAKRFPAKSLSYHWALDRAAPPGDPDREHAAEALAAYTPRALHGIVVLLNKLESLDAGAADRRALEAMLLAAFDESASIWPPAAEARGRPRTIHPPARFREFNLWRALENAVGQLAGPGGAVTLCPLDELVSQPGKAALCLFDGPAREALKALPAGSVRLAVSALPRPNPALWALSALWATWLWGRPAAGPVKTVARHRRSDFEWHEHSLRRSLQAMRPSLAAGARLIGLMPEAEGGFVESALAAADAADFVLADWAYRSDPAELQVVWDAGGRAPGSDGAGGGSAEEIAKTIRETALEASRAILLGRGEPARWATLHAGIWAALAGRRLLKIAAEAEPDHPIPLVADVIAQGHLSVPGFVRFGAKREADLAEGLWWLSDPAGAEEPLADRVEREVARRLATGSATEAPEVEAAVCREFSGVHVPGRRLLLACLSSYGESPEAGLWKLRAEDAPEARTADREAMIDALYSLGARLGYGVEAGEGGTVDWRESGRSVYAFVVLTTAAIGALLTGPAPRFAAGQIAERPCVVFPGGRAGLCAFRLRRDPRLKAAAEAHGWAFLKFRHVRRMAAEHGLDRAAFAAMLNLDPIVEKAAAQIPLL